MNTIVASNNKRAVTTFAGKAEDADLEQPFTGTDKRKHIVRVITAQGSLRIWEVTSAKVAATVRRVARQNGATIV